MRGWKTGLIFLIFTTVPTHSREFVKWQAIDKLPVEDQAVIDRQSRRIALEVGNQDSFFAKPEDAALVTFDHRSLLLVRYPAGSCGETVIIFDSSKPRHTIENDCIEEALSFDPTSQRFYPDLIEMSPFRDKVYEWTGHDWTFKRTVENIRFGLLGSKNKDDRPISRIANLRGTYNLTGAMRYSHNTRILRDAFQDHWTDLLDSMSGPNGPFEKDDGWLETSGWNHDEIDPKTFFFCIRTKDDRLAVILRVGKVLYAYADLASYTELPSQFDDFRRSRSFMNELSPLTWLGHIPQGAK